MTKGEIIYNLAKKIFPYNRSLTGEGVRKTLDDIKEYIEEGTSARLNIYGVPSGTQVFDWTVPKEWAISDGYIEDDRGKRYAEFKKLNLHILGYSAPVNREVDLAELKKYIYTQDGDVDAVPYVTSYYRERYGFCMTQREKEALPEGRYHMYIDSKLFDGELNYADVIIPGDSEQEIFFSTYFCHPSMANNECSGPALMAEIIRYVATLPRRRYTYRFVFVPETIGSITYMSQQNHLAVMKRNMVAGFNISCVGDDRAYSIVESRDAGTLADRALKNILKTKTHDNYKTYSFLDRGSDERQYNAPGIELPVVGYSRSKYGEYPEYHTSKDDMGLVSPSGFQGSYDVIRALINLLEHNDCYQMTVLGEPQLGKRGLYPTISHKGSASDVRVMMDFITYADGSRDLIAISDKIGAPVGELIKIAEKLLANDLLKRVERE